MRISDWSADFCSSDLMLLDWIAFRSPLMLRVESPLQMAQWLARHLEHVAVLHENSQIIYALIKLDEIHGDPAAVAATLGEALYANLTAPPADLFCPPHFAPGHWRALSAVLADALAVPTPRPTER